MPITANDLPRAVSNLRTLRIAPNGDVQTDSDISRENTLLSAILPACEVVCVQLPGGLLETDSCSDIHPVIRNMYRSYWKAEHEQAARNGRLYFVDHAHCPNSKSPATNRWRQYEGFPNTLETLLSPCKILASIPGARLVLSKECGTSRQGWIRQSLCEQLRLPPNAFCHFVMSFKNTQAQGTFKVMPDEVANALEADFFLPEPAVSPCDEDAMIPPNRYWWVLQSDVVLGITEVPNRFEHAASAILGILPASAIADDGFIFVDDWGLPRYEYGWLPPGLAIGNQPVDTHTPDYDVVPKEFRKLTFVSQRKTINQLLIEHLDHTLPRKESEIDSQMIDEIVETQLLLPRVWALNPTTAAQMRGLAGQTLLF